MGDFLEQIQQLLGKLDSTRELLIFALVMARTMVMITLTPFIGGKMVPMEIKMGLGILLTLLVWPLARVSMTAEINVSPVDFILLMVTQVFIGFAIGFVATHIFWAMDMAGRLIDTVRGASMAEVMAPMSESRVTPVGDMFVQLMVVIFVVSGGLGLFLDAFFYSFAQLPLNEGLQLGAGLEPFFELMLRLTGQILLLSTLIAAPVVAATFITDVVFGILNRVAPQLNAYFMSMPVKAMAGIILILVAMDPLVARMRDFVVWTLQAVQQTLDLLASKA